MAMTETYRDFTIFDEHIQRFTARTALAWKIHSRQVQIPKHTADLSPACASVLAASSRELRMNWHIWHQREEAGYCWTCKIWFIWDRWHDFQGRQAHISELPTSAPSSKAKTKTKTLITSDIRAISEGNRPGPLLSPIQRGFSYGINAWHATEAPGNPHLANAIADKTSQISKERKLRPSDIRYSIFLKVQRLQPREVRMKKPWNLRR